MCTGSHRWSIAESGCEPRWADSRAPVAFSCLQSSAESGCEPRWAGCRAPVACSCLRSTAQSGCKPCWAGSRAPVACSCLPRSLCTRRSQQAFLSHPALALPLGAFLPSPSLPVPCPVPSSLLSLHRPQLLTAFPAWHWSDSGLCTPLDPATYQFISVSSAFHRGPDICLVSMQKQRQ